MAIKAPYLGYWERKQRGKKMFEICALLASQKTSKPRAPSAPRIKPGAKVWFYNQEAIISRKHETIRGAWWAIPTDARANGKESWCHKDAIRVLP